jgi:inner membrane protein
MDSITHIAIGAIVGEACAGKSLGKKAMLIGAALQSIPDIDFVAAFFLSPTANLVAHRGITHSLLFGLVVTLGLSLLLNRKKILTFNQLLLFIGIEISIHLLLDACNAYGVGWFEPFINYRISFNFIFVADPFYSMWLGAAAIALLVLPSGHKLRMTWVKFSLLASSLYLCVSIGNKILVNKSFEKTLNHKNISTIRSFTTPTAFNNLLWYCVAESDSGYHIGYRSVFDRSEQIELSYFPRQRGLLNGLEDEEELVDLLQFSNGFYTVEKEKDILIFNDLRFGRVGGWERPKTEFAFHYYLQQPGKNMLVIQRGRFAEWNPQTLRSLFVRIKGV